MFFVCLSFFLKNFLLAFDFNATVFSYLYIVSLIFMFECSVNYTPQVILLSSPAVSSLITDDWTVVA